jgi:aryl sulfotransferase
MKMIQAMNERAVQEGIAPRATFEGDYSAFFKHWLVDNNFFDVVASYWERRAEPNLLFTHYNDLKSDLEGEMRRVAEFLAIDVPESLWPAVVERCTFEAMQNSEKRIADFDQLFEGGVKGFIFKGTNGRWRDVLTGEDLDAYRARVAEALPPECARWTEGGRHAIGMN